MFAFIILGFLFDVPGCFVIREFMRMGQIFFKLFSRSSDHGGHHFIGGMIVCTECFDILWIFLDALGSSMACLRFAFNFLRPILECTPPKKVIN